MIRISSKLLLYRLATCIIIIIISNLTKIGRLEMQLYTIRLGYNSYVRFFRFLSNES